MDLLSTVGQCDNGYACVYQNNLSWSSPTTPLPAEAHPRIVFERLFGEGGSVGGPARRAASERASLLDWVQRGHRAPAEASSAPAIARKVNEYLDTVREVERRIQKAEAETADNPLPDLDRPVGVPAAYADHARLMFDLQVLALPGRRHARHHVPARARDEQPHVPRDRRLRSAPSAHAPRQRSGEDREDGEDQRVPRVAVRVLPREAEGDAGRRRHAARPLAVSATAAAWAIPTCTITSNLPILVAGGAAGKQKGGRHIKYAEPTPLANLHLTLLDKVGVRLDSFADSQGKVDELLSV